MANVFVTGISRGFGRDLAQELIAAGHTVAGTTRDGGAPFVHERLHVFQLDVTEAGRVHKVVAEAIETLGGLDVVINNAGFGIVGAIEETTPEEVARVMDANFYGPLHVIQAALPHLRARRAGRIINFSSVAGLAAPGGYGVYAAAKFALEGMSEALEQEVKPFGISVTIVEPGRFRTDFLSGQSILKAQRQITDYDDTIVGLMRKHVAGGHGNQPGDPLKAIGVILDVMASDAPPLRLPLGPDALGRIAARNARFDQELDQWRDRAMATDLDPA